jgi:hexokinase
MPMSLSLLKNIHTNFEQELQLANTNHKTSLPFILNTIPSTPLVKNGETFQVIAVGGSMYRNALVKKENTGDLTIEYEITDRLPIFTLREDFLSFVDGQIESNTTMLALNFAYPLEPVFEKGKLDGKLIRGTKEHRFLGLVGQNVGEEIEKYILEKYKRHITVSVANDTVCLILSGLTKTKWDHLAAGIVGTGLNFALFLDKTTIVNLEAGSFNNFPQTDTGKIVDAASNMKGIGLFEKEVSGAYLYQHFNQLIKEKQVDHQPLKDTTELSYLAAKEIPGVSEVAAEQLERSAAFVATQIAGIAKFKKQPLTFIMQGSLFWKGYNYKEMVNKYVHELLPDFKINFINVDDSDVLGAAKLIA